jgi:hypothetical protein
VLKTRYVCSDTLSLTSDINHVLTREEVETRKIGRNETRTFQGLFLGCIRVNEKPGKEPNRIVSFLMERTWKADCLFLFPWRKRDTWISTVSFGFRFHSAPKGRCSSGDCAGDKPGSQFRWRDDKNSDQLWSSRTNTWGSSKVIRYLPLLSACRSHLWRSTQERDGNEISR